MRRFILAVAVLVFLLVSIPVGAADLQAGWYARIYTPYVYVTGEDGRVYLRDAGQFTTQPGTYGPFDISAGSSGSNRERYITIPSNVYGVTSDQGLVLPIYFTMNTGEKIRYMTLPWSTNYDSNDMYIELWRNRYGGVQELMWSQHLSGQQTGYLEFAYSTVFEGPYFYKIVIVPEPSSIFALTSLCGLASIRRRYHIKR